MRYTAVIDKRGRTLGVYNDRMGAGSLEHLSDVSQHESGHIRSLVEEDVFRRFSNGEEIIYRFTRTASGQVVHFKEAVADV